MIMELHEVFLTFVVPTIVFLVFLPKLMGFYAEKNVGSGKSKLPPGRRGLPIIGDSLNWYNAVASSHPPSFVEQQVARYGKIFSCNIFGKRAVVSADPNFNRFVMQNEGKLFKSSYPASFRNLVGKHGIITAQGGHQRKLHSIASNMMRLDKLKFHFLQDIQTVMDQTFTNLQDNQVILLQDHCRKVAINLMVKQLLGISSESEVDEMANLFSDFVDGCLSVPINVPGMAYHTAMKARESIISKIKNITEIHRKHMNASSHKSDSNVGDGVLKRLVEEESLADDDAAADFIINLLFAGNETTSKTMLFSVYFLTQNPKAMKQLLDEQCSLKKNNSNDEEMLTWEDYKAMPFTQCVIDETLRLGGIAIWLMREATDEVQYEDFTIPKGSFVVPFLSAVHLNEDIYSDRLAFDPWRWMMPENQDKRNWRSSRVFAPFGGGTRFCPGAELARLQIALFLHKFVTTFRWKQLKEDQMSFFPSARLVNGFQIQITRIGQQN
ncbi:oxygenase [Lithospermum erythrorhizon]|uniref:Oxygenase n=1 Tax=Lithospermum erythrorhizon TaxID=34254 RepID=A0AAV3P081_LITER